MEEIQVKILDVTMGQKWMQRQIKEMFGIDGEYVNVDIREESSNGFKPDFRVDSQSLPQEWSETFDMVLFDPPFGTVTSRGLKTVLDKLTPIITDYGFQIYWDTPALMKYIYNTFKEIYRVLKPNGICIFKWGDRDFKVERPLTLRGNFKVTRTEIIEGKGRRANTKSPGVKTIYVWLEKV